jgi:similar to stage IV sporulation protein
MEVLMKRKNSITDYFNGYILIKLENINPEAIINLCLNNGISMWEIERRNYTTIVFKMRKGQYLLFKKTVKNTNTRSKIIKKYGIYFTFNRMNRRKFFIIGSFVFITVLICCSSLIWRIDITGNKNIATSKVMSELNTMGLKRGAIKFNLDFRKIEENVLKNMKELSVIKINLDGTRVKVEIVERVMPSEIIDKDIPTNIVSSKEGIITKIFSYQGQEVAKIGDYVKPNQLLITGTISDLENNINKQVHAMGTVFAKTWYEVVQEVNLNYKITTRSNKFKTKVYYALGKNIINIKNTNINFVKYDKIKNVNRMHLLKLKLPIYKITETYYEKIDKYKNLTAKEAEAIGISIADRSVIGKLSKESKVIGRKITKISSKDKIEIKVLYTVEEKIGKDLIIK